MARWYQNVLTGEQVEVKTLDDDDFYVENKANWSRIKAPRLVQPGDAWETTGGVVALPLREPSKAEKPVTKKPKA